MNVMKQMEHPNILKTHDFSEKGVLVHKHDNKDGSENIEKDICYTVLELAPKGEIFEYLYYGGPLCERMARTLFGQMMSALKHSHSAGYAHRDIKPENLLLNDSYNLKLADFGFAKILAGDKGDFNLNTFCGTRCYMAPEILKAESYKGIEIDIFSAGIMLFLFCNGRPPFSAADKSDNVWKQFFLGNDMKTFWIEWTKMFETNFSKDYMLLVTSMLNPVASKRPDIETILNSNWMKGDMASEEEVKKEFGETRQTKVKEGV